MFTPSFSKLQSFLWILLVLSILPEHASAQNIYNLTIGAAEPGYCGTTLDCSNVLRTARNANRTTYEKGQSAVVYVRYIYDETIEIGVGEGSEVMFERRNHTVSSSFYPRVDEYSLLTIPSS